MADWVIRPLRREDDRDGFSCGEEALDRFFRSYAGQNQFRFHVATTWVAVEHGSVLGFVTTTAASLERHRVPDDRLRARLPDYPLPVLRLARLGVDLRAQGRGLGRALVRHAFELALAQRDLAGCVGVVTDAKPNATSFYASLGFTTMGGVREGLLQDATQPMFLGIRAIANAAGR